MEEKMDKRMPYPNLMGTYEVVGGALIKPKPSEPACKARGKIMLGGAEGAAMKAHARLSQCAVAAGVKIDSWATLPGELVYRLSGSRDRLAQFAGLIATCESSNSFSMA
jgi:hypothetical protein